MVYNERVFPLWGLNYVKSYVKNILVHGPSSLETVAKIFEGGKNN